MESRFYLLMILFKKNQFILVVLYYIIIVERVNLITGLQPTSFFPPAGFHNLIIVANTLAESYWYLVASFLHSKMDDVLIPTFSQLLGINIQIIVY